MANKSGDTVIVRAQHSRQGLRSPIHRVNNFPHNIAVAVVAITTGKAFPDIPRSARAVLAFAVRVAERNDPTKASWAFKKTIANEIMVSESTVYRALNILVNLGFIERFNQERRARNGKLAVAKIALTNKTCIGLGLITAEEGSKTELKPTLEPATYQPAPSVKMQDRHSSTLLSADQQTQSLKKHSPIPMHTDEPLQVQPFFKLPEELSWLNKEKLLTPPQIFLLMREFSARKQRFSEVIFTVGIRIRKLPKKDVFSYLRALAKAPTDFAWMVKQQDRVNAKEERKNNLKGLIQRLTEDMTGCYLRSSNNTIYLLDGPTARAWWIDGRRLRQGACPLNEQFAMDYERGYLQVIDKQKANDELAAWSAINRSRPMYPVPRIGSNHLDNSRTPRLGDLLRSAITKNYARGTL